MSAIDTIVSTDLGATGDAPSPTVSVVIPAYNAAATIEAAIRSALEQTRPPDEIIVVDDGSSDNTAAIVAAMHPAITLIRQANAGCGRARNTGVRSAHGDWLALLDADDLWLPTKLERQLPETADPRVGVVVCGARDKDGRSLGRRITFDDLWTRNGAAVCSALVRRNAFAAAGGFWSERACEDYHLWLRLTASGWIMANCPEDLVVYAPTVQSLSRQTETFAAAEVACITDVAGRHAIPSQRLHARLAACYLKHARSAIHSRKLLLARQFVRSSLRHDVSLEQFTLLLATYIPRRLLDWRRSMLGRQTDHRITGPIRAGQPSCRR